MFTFFQKEDPDLTEAIADSFEDLKGFNPDQKEYVTTVDQLVKLHNLKPKGVDPNTLLTVVGNLVIGVAVLKFESAGVVTSKIWSFLKKI